MSILDNLQVGKKIPVHEDYKQFLVKQEFWSEAVEVSEDYWQTKDPNGNKPLKKFTCEDKADYDWRKEISIPKNYCGSILNKYLSTSFKEKVIREESDFIKNVDLLGSDMTQFMELASKLSLIDGVSYILPDSTAQDTSLTEAQKQILGVRPFLRLIEAEDVPNWSDYLGHLMEILIKLEDSEGAEYYMYYNNEVYCRVDVNEHDNIIAVSEPVAHGFDRIPVVRVLPFDTEESFIAAGALMQLSINNLNSLEKVELYKSTFTRYFIKGVRLDQDEDGNPIPIQWGNNRMIHTESENADIKPLAADVSQADSIRKSIEEERSALFNQYHLTATQVQDATQTPSGYALQISKADFNSICNQIVKSVEKAENEIVLLFSQVENVGLNLVEYPRNFIQPNEQEDIQKLRDILALDLDEASKQIARKRFTDKYLKG